MSLSGEMTKEDLRRSIKRASDPGKYIRESNEALIGTATQVAQTANKSDQTPV